MSTDLSLIIAPYDLAEAQRKPIIDSFGDLFIQAHTLAVQAKGIKVTDESQVEDMQKARELRLQLKKVRTDADKIKVVLKDGYLRGANGIQAIFNDIKNTTEPVEKYLEQQEKFAELKEAERVAKRHTQRVEQLSKYVDDVSLYNLAAMSDEAFDKLLTNSKTAWDVEQFNLKRAEEERLQKIEADRLEQQRVREENERLKKEATKKEEELVKERAAQQAKFQAEQKAKLEAENKLRAERELQEKKELEAKQAAENQKRLEEETKRQALLAPDKEKLLRLASDVELFIGSHFPAVESKSAGELLNYVESKMNAVIGELREGAKKL